MKAVAFSPAAQADIGRIWDYSAANGGPAKLIRPVFARPVKRRRTLMQYQCLAIPEVVLFTPKVFGDDRGFFFDSFNHKVFAEATGLAVDFVQDNHSKSAHGVLRGLHYQLPPHVQGKLVRGAAFAFGQSPVGFGFGSSGSVLIALRLA
jgi:hypothetical protein